jgi:hypothetical protein
MKGIPIDDPAGRGTGAVTDLLGGRTLTKRDPTDLIFARQALDRRQFAEAERHLRRALDAEPESAEVRTLIVDSRRLANCKQMRRSSCKMQWRAGG